MFLRGGLRLAKKHFSTLRNPMSPVLCILGGCNGAGKTTLARELLPRLGMMRFLNADESEALGRPEID
jgi:2-phosphoglycerate kinase